MNRWAFIDVGSNSILMLTARVRGGDSFHILEDRSIITRLGQGFAGEGTLQPQAVDRTIKGLQQFLDLCRQESVSIGAAVGTGVLREASNREDFLQSVRRRCDLVVEVVSAQREAELSYLSVTCEDPSSDFLYIILDIGGGSTEIVQGRGGKPTSIRSVPFGCVKLTERFFNTEVVDSKAISRARDWLRGEIDCLEPPPDQFRVIGLAGTLTTLAALDLEMEHFDPVRVDGYRLGKERVGEFINLFQGKTVEERKALPGMEPGRADIILGGALILQVILEKLRADHVTVSPRGVRYGLLFEHIKNPKTQ